MWFLYCMIVLNMMMYIYLEWPITQAVPPWTTTTTMLWHTRLIPTKSNQEPNSWKTYQSSILQKKHGSACTEPQIWHYEPCRSSKHLGICTSHNAQQISPTASWATGLLANPRTGAPLFACSYNGPFGLMVALTRATSSPRLQYMIALWDSL